MFWYYGEGIVGDLWGDFVAQRLADRRLVPQAGAVFKMDMQLGEGD